MGLGCLTILMLLAAEPAPAQRPRLSFLGLTNAEGVSPLTARTLSDYVQAELNSTGLYEVISSADLEKILGIERQKALVGCADDSQDCMNELAGALNAGRLLYGNVSRADNTVIVTLSLLDPASAKVVGRAFRKVDDASSLSPVIDAIQPLVFEVVNQDPYLNGRVLRPARGFTGLGVGVRLDVDFLGFGGVNAPLAVGISADYAWRRFGVAVTLFPKPDFGARLEARWYPLVLAERIRLHLAVGSSVFLSGASIRAGGGGTLKLGQLRVFADLGYELFPAAFNSRFIWGQHAVVLGAGAGWLF